MRAFRSVRFKRLAFTCLLPVLLSRHVQAADDRPWIGMDIEDCRFENTVLGVGVARVEDGSPAWDAGIVPGDILVSMEGMALAGSDDLICRAFVLTPGQRVRLAVLRGGDLRSFTVTLAMWPLKIPQPSRSCLALLS
jgi:S1-C subfamily serine protease